MLSACVGVAPSREVKLIDSLNTLSYNNKYKSLNLSDEYAHAAFDNASLYKQGKAEACNNLAFCAFIKMDFEKSEQLYKDVHGLTKNELECLIADVGLMRIYQRTAMNKEFYDYRNSALKRMKRIREDISVFTDRHETKRLNYAFSEFYLVSATYYYYLQQRREALESLHEVAVNNELKSDTNQYLGYNYFLGYTGLGTETTLIRQKLFQFDELYNTMSLASEGGYNYYMGTSLQSLSELLMSKNDFDLFVSRRMHMLQALDISIDSLLPLRLAQEALKSFKKYGDNYQIAGTYVTIGKYLNMHQQYAAALDTLSIALNYVNRHHQQFYDKSIKEFDKLHLYNSSDTTYTEMVWIEHEQIKTLPEWISRIREQLSVSYAGLELKKESDYNRNIYLDILNDTRQDKELESRYLALENESRQLSMILFLVIIGIVIVAVLFVIFNRRSKIRNTSYVQRLQKTLSLCRDITSTVPMNVELVQQGLNDLLGDNKVLIVNHENSIQLMPKTQLSKSEQALVHILHPYIEWASDNELTNSILNDEQSQLDKQRYIYEQHIIINKRQNIVKKACLSIVTGITPYIDRMLNEINKLIGKGYINDTEIKKAKYQYIEELVNTINEYNDILALWIKMKQGKLSLNIETFSLEEIFELLSKGRRTFDTKKQTFNIQSTDLWVKADKALTAFMINTLVENARKYTQEGGEISLFAEKADDYIEISVQDNGRGLSEEDLMCIRDQKIYNSHEIGVHNILDENDTLLLSKGSGFGLINCKGIIEKYKKTNSIFSVCLFGVESKLGKGSRFYFRLPIGIKRTLYTFAVIFTLFSCQPRQNTLNIDTDNALLIYSKYDYLLNEASDYANEAYYANINNDYQKSLLYVDSALVKLNQYYKKCYPDSDKELKLVDDIEPVEIEWWNSLINTDYHVILDIRNEAAVAFLALKQINGYNYNNRAYTSLYKLQGEDKSLENYCRDLVQSSINKFIGIVLCVLLLIAALIGYYIISYRKRKLNQIYLEQVFEINKKIFSSSISSVNGDVEALQLEENALNEIPRRLVSDSFNSINDLFNINNLGLGIYNANLCQLIFTSQTSGNETPIIVSECFKDEIKKVNNTALAIPLIIDKDEKHRCIGVLYLDFAKDAISDTDYIMSELIAGYFSIVVYNAIIKMANKYRDIEFAHENAKRASWEDSILHIQNMVLDNCLSTIKHETIYYPNRIKQIVRRLNNNEISVKDETDNVVAISELIEYYKGIFTILSSCASRQLEDITFRRGTIEVRELIDYAIKYFHKASRKLTFSIDFTTDCVDGKIVGDIIQLKFLIENLIEESLNESKDGDIVFNAIDDNDFVRFQYTDTRRNKSVEELNLLFNPNLKQMTSADNEKLKGTEFLICKQIIREHDEFAGKRGCRINAIPSNIGGYTIYFTLPIKTKINYK